MDDTHRKFYDNVKDGIKEECNKINLDVNNTLALTTRLRQATTCPSILTTNVLTSTKINRAVELVEQIIENNAKVVIMSTFKQPLLELYDILKAHKPLLGTGDVSDDQFSKNVDLFQNNDNYKIFLGTTQKAGTGITLNAASYMICIDTPWTSALQQQVEDRIHRADNINPVIIYRLICQDTIDEVVENILQTKKAISEFIVDDKLDDNAINLLKQYIQDL